MKIRTIITQDAEVNNQNSLRHFLFYANKVNISYQLYKDASAACVSDVRLNCENHDEASVYLPMTAKQGDQIHVIVKVQTAGHYKLTHYQQVIITIK